MAVNDFSNQNIQDTYQRVVQTDGTNVADGTGSLLPISFEGNNVIVPGALKAQSYIVSESIINVSSGSTVFGNSLDDTHTFKGAITSSGGISSSGQINANKIRAGNYAGSSVFDIAAGAGGIDTDGAMSCTGFSNSSTTTLGGRVILTGASAYIETPSYVSASRIITTNLTASGNISSSENIIANRFFAEGALAKGHISLNSSNSHLGVNTGWTVGTNLTASGDISASRIIASKATINEGFIIVTGSSTSHGFQLSRDGLDTYKIRHLDGGLTIQNSSDNRKEMTFDGTGNVGIGTTSPTSKLQVEGSISASGFIRGGSGTFGKFTMNNDQLVFTENDTTGFTFQSETINVKVNDQDFIDLEADESLIKMFKGTRFSSNINVLSNITASGNISASGTGNNIFGGDILLNGDRSIKDITGLNDLDIVPGAKLRLGNTSTDVVEIGRQSGTGAAGRTEIYANTSTPAAKFSLSTITFNHPITASNDISASGELSVTNNTFIGGRLSVNTTSTTGRVNVVGTQAHQLSGGSNTFKITGVSNTNALFISSSGKVGVGTTSPEESLHVVGNVRIASSDPNLRIEDTNGRSVEIDVTDDTFRIDDVGNNAAIFTTDLSTNPTQTTFQTKPTFLRDVQFDSNINTSGNITASGNISASGTIVADEGSGKQFTVRPNLFFFATNTGTNIENEIGTGAGDQEGSLPNTNTTTVGLTEEQNSHAGVFDLTNNRLTISRAGLYRFSYNCSIEIANGSGRCESYCGLVQETSGGTITTVDGTEGRGYHRFVEDASTAASGQSMGATVVVNVAAGSKYDMRFGTENQDVANSNLQTIPQGTSFYVEALT